MKLKSILKFGCISFCGLFVNANEAFSAGMSFAQYAYNNAKEGNVANIKKYIAKGYNINGFSQDGYTAICYALANNDKDAYIILRSVGASVNKSCVKEVASRDKIEEFNDEFIGYAKNNIDKIFTEEELREIYATTGSIEKEKSSINKKYVVAGLLGAGGLAALASGGGGGSSALGNQDVNPCQEGYHLVGNSCIPDEGVSDNVDIVNGDYVQGGEVNVNNNTNNDVFAVYSTGNGVYNLYSAYAHQDDYAKIDIKNRGNGMVNGVYGEGFVMNAFVDGMREAHEINSLNDSIGEIFIDNEGRGNVYGIYSKVMNANNSWEAANAYGVDYGTARGYININNKGKGTTYGVFGDDRAYNAFIGWSGSSLGSINIKSDGDIYGVSGYIGVFNATSHQYAPGVEGKGIINIESIGDGNVYGISVQKSYEETDNNVHQWFVINAAGDHGSKVEGNINIHNIGNGNSYGIYGGGTMYNALAYDGNALAGSTINGNINIVNKGNGNSYGMYMPNVGGLIKNLSYGAGDERGRIESVINIVNAGDGVAVGMRGAKGADIENSGEININNIGNGSAIGIYGESNSRIVNNGLINIYREVFEDEVDGEIIEPETENGGRAFGIYAQNGARVQNRGDIIISGAESGAGIYLENGAVIENSGNIIFNGQENSILSGGAIDVYSSSKSVLGDLNSLGGGEVILAQGGRFFADKLSGDISVSDDIVKDGFKDKYVEIASLQSKDVEELNLKSKSYMFDASSSENKNGGYDVVLTRKGFDDLIEDKSVSEFLENNYSLENNEKLYASLKSANSQRELDEKVASNLGGRILPNFRSENAILYRNLSRDFDEGLDSDKNYMGGYKYVDMSLDDDGVIKGGDVEANVAYGLLKDKNSNGLVYGLGISMASIDGKYGSEGSRDSKTFGVWVPVKYELNNGVNLRSKLYLGYNDTKYNRYGEFGKRSASFDEYQYGLNSSVSKKINLVGGFEFEPLAELNMFGMYQNGFNEGNLNNAIKVDDNNNLTVEAGLGAFLRKDVIYDNDKKLGVKLGGLYYVEFFEDGKSFDVEMNNMSGKYSIAHRKNQNRGALMFRAMYDYKNFSIHGGIEKEFGNNDALLIDAGLKYNF